MPDAYLPLTLPPSSPPTKNLRASNTAKQTRATIKNTTTEKANGPAFTS